jgi:hypothetical protein
VSAWRCLQLAEVMAEFDADWHVLIGSFVGENQAGQVIAADSVVFADHSLFWRVDGVGAPAQGSWGLTSS